MRASIIVLFLFGLRGISGAQSLTMPADTVHIKTIDFSIVNKLSIRIGLVNSFYSGNDYAVVRLQDNADEPAEKQKRDSDKNYLPHDKTEQPAKYADNNDQIRIITSPYMFYLYNTDINNDIASSSVSR